MISSNGPTFEFYYSQHLHDEHSAYTNSDNEYSFQPYIMEDFPFKLKQVHHNFVYITYAVVS
jgi:hypothetical protein